MRLLNSSILDTRRHIMYIHSETIAGDTVLVKNYHSNRYRKKVPDRAPATGKCTESQEDAHKRRDIEELTIRLNENFHPKDYYMTFTYRLDARPETVEQAKKDRTELLRRLRRLHKRQGKELKFIAVTEFGKQGALHHHMVLNSDVDYRMIADCWDKGRAKLEELEEEREYSKLAAYIVKSRDKWKANGGKGRMWTCSRNLVRPPTKRWIRRAKSFLDEPRAKKGWRIIKDTMVQGYTDEGHPYQKYMMIRSRGDPP